MERSLQEFSPNSVGQVGIVLSVQASIGYDLMLTRHIMGNPDRDAVRVISRHTTLTFAASQLIWQICFHLLICTLAPSHINKNPHQMSMKKRCWRLQHPFPMRILQKQKSHIKTGTWKHCNRCFSPVSHIRVFTFTSDQIVKEFRMISICSTLCLSKTLWHLHPASGLFFLFFRFVSHLTSAQT